MASFEKFIACGIPLFLLFQFASCAAINKTADNGSLGDPGIDVAIITGAREVSLSGRELKVKTSGKDWSYGHAVFSVRYAHDGIFVDGFAVKSESLAVEGKEIKVNGRPYRGSISIFRERKSLTVVNSLGLESYLMGIINHEISSKWPIESVKAQAVAARTYAYLKLKSKRQGHYHLEASVTDQVYGGSLTEDRRGQSAVNATRGEILFHKGKVARTLYHSVCGGYTESAVNVWGRDFPYLRSVEDTFCSDAPHYFWTYRTNGAELLDSLRKKGYLPHEGSQGIRVLQKSDRGRIKKVSLAGVELSGNDFRELVGYENIKSTLFIIETRANEVIFSGSGAGHGVGMCQWGAKGMAEVGMSYKDILKHYYNGTYIRKVY